MQNRRNPILLLLALIFTATTLAQKIDYSVISVPEETGVEFVKMTRPGDYVAMPEVCRGGKGVTWMTNKILGVSPDGKTLAFISDRSGVTNIFVKDIDQQGSAAQRTNRQHVVDFSYSPDGKSIVFSEACGKFNQIFTTDAKQGYICRQITSGDSDYAPTFSNDKQTIFFTRAEKRGSSVWGYDLANNFLSSYFAGSMPIPVPKSNEMLVTRINGEGRSEIWRVNLKTGVEECLISDPLHSFTSPSLSPDGRWILLVGDGHLQKPNGTSYNNTDIFVCRANGTGLSQVTYHAADDLSPVWSPDGNYIYFISRRGDAEGVPNVWRMNFNSAARL